MSQMTPQEIVSELDSHIVGQKAAKRAVGIYPETKHPTYFRSIGLPIEEPMLRLLRSRGLDRADAPVFIQSFEDGNLRTLATPTRVRLVQVVSTASQVTPAALRDMATFWRTVPISGSYWPASFPVLAWLTWVARSCREVYTNTR